MDNDGIVSLNAMKVPGPFAGAKLQIAYDLALRTLGLHLSPRLTDDDITKINDVMWNIYKNLQQRDA